MIKTPFKATHRHYKGGLYQFLTEAVYSEDQTYLVVYRDKRGTVWARPAGMFFGEVDGQKRFTFLGDEK